MPNMDDLYRLLRSGHLQAQGIVDTIQNPLVVLDRAMNIVDANKAFFETFHTDRFDSVGISLFASCAGRFDIPELRSLLAEVLPRANAVIDYAVSYQRPDGDEGTWLLTARKLQSTDLGSTSLLLTIVDATDRYQLDADKDMLVGELRHRMRNLLSVARALARLTTTQGRSAEAYREDFLGRFEALIEAQDLIFIKDDGTDVRHLCERLLAPYLSVTAPLLLIGGVSAVLDADHVQPFSLILHELATNAVKHGAWSAAGGQVRVTWRIAGDVPRMHFRWEETGGPAVAKPATAGFGTRLIQSMTTPSAEIEASLDYRETGLVAEIIVPATIVAA